MPIQFLFLFVFFTAASLQAQEKFTNCTAAFLDGKIMVNEYTPKGHCEIQYTATGKLTVQTADLSPEKSIPTGKILFRIAIFNGQSKTLFSFSDKNYQEINIQDILSKCHTGDAIVLLTTDDRYALPHHEILVK